MSESASAYGFAEIRCHRYGADPDGDDRDTVIIEEPLELRVDGAAVVTVMRTPGHDRDLALGLLHGESWIDSLRDIDAVVLCGRRARHALDALDALDGKAPDATSRPGNVFESGNVVDVRLADHVPPPPSVRPRLAMSSCGVCGKRTIEEVLGLTRASLRSSPAPSPGGPLRSSDVIARLPAVLREHQTLFERTGSVHAAALFDHRGRPLVVREDVGRHNAVDKVIGWALLGGALPLSDVVLQVSGRVSFEIVQKAFRAGIPMVAAVSGVSTLASELAVRAGITLIGFLRGGSFNVYAHPERLSRSGPAQE